MGETEMEEVNEVLDEASAATRELAENWVLARLPGISWAGMVHGHNVKITITVEPLAQ